MNQKRALQYYLLFAIAIIVVDQVTKLQIESTLSMGYRITIIPSLLDITKAYNTGAAFSFLAAEAGWQRWLFLALALAASSFLLLWIRQQAHQPRLCLALASILGGAVGNAIDRLQHGHVIDFILVHWQETWFFPVFNIADIAITLGALVLILDEWLRWKKSRAAQQK